MNIWAILVSVIIFMVIGMLWYSPILFGNIWLKLVDKKADDISKEESNKAMSFSFIPAIISAVSLAYILYLAGADTILKGIIISCILSVGISGMSMINLVLFENRSIKLTLLNLGYNVVSMLLASILLVLW